MNNGKDAYTKEKYHAEQVPFYMRLYVPEKSKDAILILQRLSVKGINDIVKGILRDYFDHAHPDYILDFKAAVTDYALAAYFNQGKATSITFVKHSIPADIADKVSNKKKEQKGRLEYTIKARDESFFRKEMVIKNMKNQNSIINMYSFDDFTPDEIQLSLLISGKLRKINILDNRKIRSTFDVTGDVKTDTSGYPNQKDIASAAQQILSDMAPSLKLKI